MTRIWNNLGHSNLLGHATRTSTAAPSNILNLPGGVNKTVSVSFMGFIIDSASSNPYGASITNTVVLRLQ